MSAVDVGGLGRRARVTSLSVALRGRLAPITARIGALALAVFLRPLLALVLLALVVAVPSFLATVEGLLLQAVPRRERDRILSYTLEQILGAE